MRERRGRGGGGVGELRGRGEGKGKEGGPHMHNTLIKDSFLKCSVHCRI